MDQEEKKLKIDIAGIIGGKNPRLIKVIPRFLITLLTKLIHQDEINVILGKYGNLRGKEFAKATLQHLNIKFKVHGVEKIDTTKRYIFVSNHPLGGLDGMILIDIFGEVFKNVRFVVNDLLMSIEPLRPVFIPVNKYGRQNVDNAKLIHDSYSSNEQILYFPAGLCSRLVKGAIVDLDWKKSFVNQAIKYGRDIVPIFFEGKNSGFFYRFANIRKSLGIKFNYETILLPHEMFRQKGATFNIYIGEPVPLEQLAGGGNSAYWTQKIREEVYNLKDQKWNR